MVTEEGREAFYGQVRHTCYMLQLTRKTTYDVVRSGGGGGYCKGLMPRVQVKAEAT
jgi:hypothetical protein